MDLMSYVSNFNFGEIHKISELEAGYITDMPYRIHELSKQSHIPSELWGLSLVLEAGTRFDVETMEHEFFIKILEEDGGIGSFTLTLENASKRVSRSHDMYSGPKG